MLKISKKLIIQKNIFHKQVFYKTKLTSLSLAENPYIRLGRYEKPIGTLLLYIPCTWGIALGAPGFDLLILSKYLSLFGVGSLMLRSAGCAINDLWDKEYDKKVNRTKNRPLASGELTEKQAFKFLFIHLMGGLCVLKYLNLLTVGLSFGIVPLVVLYPLAKRVSNYPQFFLGMAFNWGIITGYTAINGAFNWQIIIPAYIAGISWTLIYDTIYAHQDKLDDKKIGLKSTALTWSNNTKKILKTLNSLVFMGLATSGYFAGMNLYIFLPILAASSKYLMSIIEKFNPDDPNSCNKGFIDNKWFGAFIFVGIFFGKFY